MAWNRCWGFLVLCWLLVASMAGAQDTTELRFVADGPTPVFKITSIIVEDSGLSLTSEMTEVLKRMELLTLAPGTIAVPNGNYLLNWGGTEDFSRTFPVKAEGRPVEIRLSGNRTAALISLGAAAIGGLGALVAAPTLTSDSPASFHTLVGSATVSVAGLIGLAVFWPRVEIR